MESPKGTTNEARTCHIDEISPHNNIKGIKRALCLDEDANTNDQPLKRTRYLSTVPILRGYKHWKKDKQQEMKWNEYGHLPRLSTIRKYVGNSQQWKTPSLLSNFRPKTGGYTAMPNKIKNIPEIQTPEQGIALGFKVIKYNGL
jgi:hypothetical protein